MEKRIQYYKLFYCIPSTLSFWSTIFRFSGFLIDVKTKINQCQYQHKVQYAVLHATDCKPFKNWQYIMYKIFIDKNQRAVVCVVGRDMLTINTTFKEFSIIQLLQDLTELSWNYNYLFSKHFAQSISRDHSQKQYCNEDWKLTKDKDKDSSGHWRNFKFLQWPSKTGISSKNQRF